MNVVVLMGGWSSEREVSLTSGQGVVEALRGRGWSNVTAVDMDRNVASVLTAIRPDVVFNALHGTPGEDGTVQGMLDLMQIPYTHSGLETSVIAIDKELTKMVLVPGGIRMPKGKVVESDTLYDGDPMARPYVLKPVNEGSSVGVAIVTNDSNYGNPIGRDVEGPWKHFDHLLAEPFIKGHELTVAVIGGEALCVTELKPKVGFYDYDSKYTDGLTEHVCPAEVPDNIAKAMMDMAARAHKLLGCKGASRSDFRWDEEQGEEGIYLLEVNTQPGMTPLSLVPEQARQRGIEYGELVERLIAEALDDAAQNARALEGAAG
nr:D-alanine--D-alanine ligase [Sphingomonas alba]